MKILPKIVDLQNIL